MFDGCDKTGGVTSMFVLSPVNPTVVNGPVINAESGVCTSRMKLPSWFTEPIPIGVAVSSDVNSSTYPLKALTALSSFATTAVTNIARKKIGKRPRIRCSLIFKTPFVK